MRTASGQRSRTVFKNSTPGDTRHALIAEYDLDRFLSQDGFRLAHRGGFQDVEIVFEDAFEGFDAPQLVVDNENGGELAHGALRRPSG